MYKKDENIFKTIFDLSPDPILIIKEEKFIDCNQAAVNIMGANSKDELIQIHPSTISPKKQPDGINSLDKANDMMANADKEGVARFEWLHTKIDGSKLYVEVTLTKFVADGSDQIHVHWKDISEKYTHLKIIKDTYTDYKTLLETMLDGYWIVNSTGDIIDVNRAYCNMSGYSQEELLKMKISDLEIAESPEETKKHIEKIISKGTDLFETTHRRKDGELIYFEISVTYVNKNGGEFIALLRNITEQKKLIKKLILNKENLKKAQRLAQIGHWELDLINNNLYWSDEVYRIFGLEPQEFNATYEAFLQYVHPEDHVLVNDAYAKSVENITSYEIIHRVVTKQGNIKYVEERCNHEVDLSGNVYKSIGTVHDITQRIKYEKDLQLASSVFEYSSDAILISDENNKIVAVNNVFENLTGYSIDEIKAKNPRVISSGWGDKEFYTQMWSDISNKGIWTGEIWDRKKSGTLYAASQSIIEVKDNDKKVINYIGISHDITESKENEKKIKQLAFYDFLTKLPNRRLFQQEVESFIKSSHFSDKKFAILFLDLDNFKWVNDSLGHHVGDKVLIHVSKLIDNILSEDTILARLGGDEFIILAPYENLLTISQLAHKVIDTVKNPITLDRVEVNVGWSIGISLFPENGSSYNHLLQNADTAMYGAKENGKNNFKYFSKDMNTSAKRRLEIDTRLRHAVEYNEFSLVYQPKVCCDKKNILGFEALIRWNDSKLGWITPDEFIPIAEQSGYIYEIGLWVLEKALVDLNTIHKEYDKKYQMAINISGIQLEDIRFLDDVKRLISKTKVPVETIEFEITETAIMKNIQKVIPVLEELKKIDIKLAIDDFGTGYSSLVYLKKMPIDTLKIDREFISEIEKDNDDKVIVEATIALANSLKLTTVAEGVETSEQSSILKNMQCNVYQGYYYSKPLNISDLFIFLNKM